MLHQVIDVNLTVLAPTAVYMRRPLALTALGMTRQTEALLGQWVVQQL